MTRILSKQEEVELAGRQEIARLLTCRCINCYSKLPGYNVHGTGWNWLTPNVGPLCDVCDKEVQSVRAVGSER